MIHILLIEDNLEMAENTSEILSLSSYNVTVAHDGKEGVKKALDILPDIILCDIMMPEMDGYGVLYALSKNPNTKEIPFIFLTAKADKTDLRKGMELGADDYLTKPYNDLELLHAVETRLKKKQPTKAQVLPIHHHADLAKTLKAFIDQENIAKRNFDKKEFLYTEGTLPYYVYFIKDGKVKITYHNEVSKEITVQIIGKNQLFGLDEVFNNEPYSCSAITIEEAQIYSIEKGAFLSLIEKNKHLSILLNQLFIDRIKDLEKRLYAASYLSVRKRVANALVWLYNKYDKQNIIIIPREDLANLIGISPESAIRTLSEYKESGWITTEGSEIVIKDIEALINLRN